MKNYNPPTKKDLEEEERIDRELERERLENARHHQEFLKKLEKKNAKKLNIRRQNISGPKEIKEIKIPKAKQVEIKYPRETKKTAVKQSKINNIYKFIVEASPAVKDLRFYTQTPEEEKKGKKKRKKDDLSSDERNIITNDKLRAINLIYKLYGYRAKYAELGPKGLNIIIDTDLKKQFGRCLEFVPSGHKGVRILVDKNIK